MLYHRILEIEKAYPSFNLHVLSIEDLAVWAEQIGARILPEPRSSHPSAKLDVDGQKIIQYNPNKSEALQIIILGHEIGHLLLGHLEMRPRRFSTRNLIMQNGWERDASIIGYLCLIPTPELIRMAKRDACTAEELFAELQPMFGDDHELGIKICEERIQIFQGLIDVCGGRCLRGESCENFREPTPLAALPLPTHLSVSNNGVRVVTTPFEVEPGGEYRLRRDPANVIRVKWKSPAVGRRFRLLVRDVPVAGVSRDDAKAATVIFMSGRNRVLRLERDPHNPYDANAIRVLAHWEGRSTGMEYSEQIGWVPKRLTAKIARDVPSTKPLYATIRTLFVKTDGKGPGLRFDIWV